MNTLFDTMVKELFPKDALMRGIDLEELFPTAHVYDEQKDSYIALVDIPGVKKEDLKVTVTKNRLHVKGTRKQDGRVYERTLILPLNANLEEIDAALYDGVLEVKIKKQTVDSPRTVEVR